MSDENVAELRRSLTACVRGSKGQADASASPLTCAADAASAARDSW
ncbi:hypothetical protein ITJ57_18795 [Plantibacter sp. VKM Ac-2880]|nr:hypothetical protein [Plantibacter sp. VKM Ac-2880]